MLELAEELGLTRPLAPARRRLLPRRPARLDVDAARAADASRACGRRPRRASSPSCCAAGGSPTTRRSTTSRSRRGRAAPAATGCGSASGGRCSTPSSTAHYDDLPATYLWSRMRRTAGTRDRKGREVMGWIEGGYQALVDALAAAIRAARRRGPHLAPPVRSIPARTGRAPASCSTPACARTTRSSPRCCARTCAGMLGARARARARPGPVPLPRHRLRRRARAQRASARTTR